MCKATWTMGRTVSTKCPEKDLISTWKGEVRVWLQRSGSTVLEKGDGKLGEEAHSEKWGQNPESAVTIPPVQD